MRFTNPRNGDVREKKAFLFFPKTLKTKQGDLITRWLEFAEWKQEYIVYVSPFWSDHHWTDIE